MIASKADEHGSGDFVPCWNYPKAAHIPGRYPYLTKRYLPPPRRTPRGGLNDRENFDDRRPVRMYLTKDAEIFPPDAGEERELLFNQKCIAIEITNCQVIRRHRNQGMPTRLGQSPKERQTFVKKRTLGCDFKTERGEMGEASS
jgi:hypothetical protein